MHAVLNAIAKRRSVRRFERRPVEEEKLEAMLEAARLAPSSCNLQHCRVLVVDHEDDLDVVRRSAYSTGAIAEAPLVLLCMADTSLDEPFARRWEEMARSPNPSFDFTKLRSGRDRPFELRLGREWALINAAIAGQHMMLQAVEMGLGTCWVHHFEHDEVRSHFNLPPHLEFLALMAVGYPAEVPPENVKRTEVRYRLERSPSDKR
jgi:nitroreductase